MSSDKHCGFCNYISDVFRRIMCFGDRRGSTDSQYRELGNQDQDALKADISPESEIVVVETQPQLHRSEDDHCFDTSEVEVSKDSPRQDPTDVENNQSPQVVEAKAAGPVETAQGPVDEAQVTKKFKQGPVEEVQGPIEEVQGFGEDSEEEVQGSVENALVLVEKARDPEEEALEVAEVAVEISDDKLEDYAQVNERVSRSMTKTRQLGRFMSLNRRRKKRLVTRLLTENFALLDDLLNGQIQRILELSAVWEFNAFTLDTVAGGRGLTALCIHLFYYYGLMALFRLDPVRLWKLMTLIEQNYHTTNPYHNSIHAADVTQAMHCFLQQDQILPYMQPMDIMAGLLAAIAHDLDHPGVNQPFLVSTNNHLVDLYQNESVLENHHWRAAISCINESNLFADIPECRDQIQEKIKSLILATDITRQQNYLDRFTLYMNTNTLDLRRADHRHLILQISLKCADISNPCRPWEVSQKWSIKVCEEFFRQGDIERRFNLSRTPLCDRYNTRVPSIQSGFYNYVVTPLITAWHRFLQSDLSEQMLINLVANHDKWTSFTKETKDVGIQTLDTGDNTDDSDTDDADDGVDDDIDEDDGEGMNLTGSSEMLLPRRSSLNPTPTTTSFREQLRRLSVPLNLVPGRPRNRERRMQDVAGALDPADDRFADNLPALLGGPSAGRVLSTENLLPNYSIASITTSQQAQRLSRVFNEEDWQLIRQPTFPPLEMSRAYSLIPTALSHEASQRSRAVQSDRGNQFDSRVERRRAARRRALSRLTARELRFRDLRDAIPNVIARTLTPRSERASARRGSAPAHVTEDRQASGARSRNFMLAARIVPENAHPLLQRRGSLPVEVITGISSY